MRFRISGHDRALLLSTNRGTHKQLVIQIQVHRCAIWLLILRLEKVFDRLTLFEMSTGGFIGELLGAGLDNFRRAIVALRTGLRITNLRSSTPVTMGWNVKGYRRSQATNAVEVHTRGDK